MKYVASSALILMACCGTSWANEALIHMKFSGNGAPSAANLQQPDSTTGEENVTGKGALGSFTFRDITAEANSPSASAACTGGSRAYFPRLAGGGVFRFEDGSLLKVKFVEGGDCVDFVASEGHCRLLFRSRVVPTA
jgi:hypothetical protein